MKIKGLVKKLVLGSAITLSSVLSGCGVESMITNPQYVEEGCADVRGTWYQHGSTSGGWYGNPNDPKFASEWGFSWYYLKQYGNKIEGKSEYEFYKNNNKYNSLPDVVGNVEGNKVYLQVLDDSGATEFTVETTAEGDVMTTEKTTGEGISGRKGNFDRISPEIERRKDPWKKLIE